MFRNCQGAVWGLLVLASTSTVNAQGNSWAEKLFDRTTVDFGVASAGAETKLRIGLKNVFAPAVHIAAVKPSCGCISARLSNDNLASGEQGYIELTLDTIAHKGQKNVSVTIVIDSPQYTEVRIPIAAYIRTDVVMTPGAAQFGSVSKGNVHERKLSLAYAGRDNWQITGVNCKNPHIACKPVVINRSFGRVDYELTVSIKPTAPIGDLREQIVLITDDAGNPQVPLIVEARVEPEFTVSPEIVSFGVIAPGEKKTINVVVRGRKPFQIQKVESEKSVGAFEVRMPKDPKVIHVIPLTLVAPSQQGQIDEKFTLTIKELGETVHFRVLGKILGATASQTVAPSLAN